VWGVGGVAPTPKPPIPNPQSPIPNMFYYLYIKILNSIKNRELK